MKMSEIGEGLNQKIMIQLIDVRSLKPYLYGQIWPFWFVLIDVGTYKAQDTILSDIHQSALL